MSLQRSQNSLQHQIEEEIQREAKIDKAIDVKVKKWFKANKFYKRVYSRVESTGLLIYVRSNLANHTFMYNNYTNKSIPIFETDSRLTVINVKHKNQHDNKRSTLSYIDRSMVSNKKFYTNDKPTIIG